MTPSQAVTSVTGSFFCQQINSERRGEPERSEVSSVRSCCLVHYPKKRKTLSYFFPSVTISVLTTPRHAHTPYPMTSIHSCLVADSPDVFLVCHVPNRAFPFRPPGTSIKRFYFWAKTNESQIVYKEALLFFLFFSLCSRLSLRLKKPSFLSPSTLTAWFVVLEVDV